MVKLIDEVTAMFLGERLVITGESYVNKFSCVPSRLARVTTVRCEIPKPGAVFRHETKVDVMYTLVWHDDWPSWIVGLTFVMPKFMPLTVSMDDPVWAALGKSMRVTTGESYVKVLRLVPAMKPRLSATEETSPAPAASLHVIELAVVQVDVAQIVEES